jgi:tetratricopeptide (TPR) repeat protein
MQNYLSQAKEKQKAKDYSAALELYKMVEAQDPYSADLLSDIGVVLFNLDRKKEALEYLDRAANLEPNNSYRYSSRAFVKGAMGDVLGGIEDYKKCIELDPEDAVAYNNLGMLEEQLGYKKQAEDSFKKADELAELLADNNITLESETEIKTSETHRENTHISKEESPATTIGILKNIVSSKQGFKEFIKFIKNGFKL